MLFIFFLINYVLSEPVSVACKENGQTAVTYDCTFDESTGIYTITTSDNSYRNTTNYFDKGSVTNDNIKIIKISEYVTSIGNSLAYNLVNLETVEVEGNLFNIANSAPARK